IIREPGGTMLLVLRVETVEKGSHCVERRRLRPVSAAVTDIETHAVWSLRWVVEYFCSLFRGYGDHVHGEGASLAAGAGHWQARRRGWTLRIVVAWPQLRQLVLGGLVRSVVRRLRQVLEIASGLVQHAFELSEELLYLTGSVSCLGRVQAGDV